MTTNLKPEGGKFYRDVDEDETFQVITVDEENELVEIQYDDGDIEEVDFETFAEFDLVEVESLE